MPYRNSLLAALLCGVCGCPAATWAQGTVTFTGGPTYIAPHVSSPGSGTISFPVGPPTFVLTSTGIEVNNLQYEITQPSSSFSVRWSASIPFTVSGGAFLATPSLKGHTTIDTFNVGEFFVLFERILDSNGISVASVNYQHGSGGLGAKSDPISWDVSASAPTLLQPGNYTSVEESLVEAGVQGRTSPADATLSFHSDYAASIAPAAPPADVPEPGSIAFLIGSVVSGAAFLRRRQNARKAA